MDASPSSSRPPQRTSSSSDSLSFSSYSSATLASTSSIQSISAILNNPLSSRFDASWSLWPSAGHAGAALDAAIPPSAPATPLPAVSRADFAPYLAAVGDPFARFADVCNHRLQEEAAVSESAQGSALVACLREVPSLFFKEDFALEDGATFHAACPFSSAADENAALQERLTQYLDVVETHLVREIALRSGSFYEAQGRLQSLEVELVMAVGKIRELKNAIRILNGGLLGAACQVQELNGVRGSLVALQQKLAVILYVSQALAALKLLVAAADCAGALDVIDNLQHFIDTDELTGLHCFRHMRDQLSVSLDSVNSILSAEFVRAAIPDNKAIDAMILSNVKKRASGQPNGIEHEINLDEDDNTLLRDRLLPFIICLLRTVKLPAVLRIYRETLITVMKAAIKSTVAELLPVLVARSSDNDFVSGERAVDSDVGGQTLANKLRNLTADNFSQLLAAIFKIVQVHLTRAAEVKKVVEFIMGKIDGDYGADSTVVVAATHGSFRSNDNGVALHSSHSLDRSSSKISLAQLRSNEMSSPNFTKNFRADVLRENTEAVFAACDAAHGRWAKLLGVRAALHPKLRLQDFLSIYNITQDFIASTEKIGGRLGYSIRGTIQSQSKAFIDYQHDTRMTKIKAVLDQETWVSVEVPDEFQAIVLLISSNESRNSIEVDDGGSTKNEEMSSLRSGEHHGSTELAENMSSSENQPSTSPQSRDDTATSAHTDERSNAGHARPASQTIVHGGVGYHMVNCGLILLKMLSEYMDISRYLTSLSSEVAQRVVEILKLFNTRTCQLVLGAGAMQVSGLKSITSKHLALASQIVSFVYALIPDIKQSLFLKIPEARKQLLASEFERVAQDYKTHRDEIHSKLVQIMRERLLANLRKLPQIVESWNSPDDDQQPSQFAKAVTKEVTYLHRILSQTLLEVDVQAIFRQVVQIFHSHITDSYSKLDLNTPQAKDRLCQDVQLILSCIRKLPSDNLTVGSVANYGLLDEFLAERFGTKVGE